MHTTQSARVTIARTLLCAALPAFIAGCGATAANPPAAPEATAEVAPAANAADLLFAWLTGTFDSSAHAARDPDNYRAVVLTTCVIDAPAFGERVLWVEQAIVGDEAAPYRQRVYRVIDGADAASSAISEVYEFADPTPYTGFCAGTSQAVPDPAQAELRAGCEVHMQLVDGALLGGTVGEGCVSTLRGASWATSAVTVTPEAIHSWDRGFGADGLQVWGAELGAYEFLRR